MAQLEIDGQAVEVPDGSTLMDAAHKLGLYVPHFCYHEKLSIAANCRMCLVQVEKAPKPLPACATPASNGMKVWTHSEQAVTAQKGVMEFLLINHPLDCPICDQGGECQLQDLAVGYGGSGSRYDEPKRVVTNKNLGPLISTDMTRCIQCTRCVRFGQEIAGVMELGMIGRGEHSEIITFVGKTVDSELSGNVIDLCPVGALTSKPFRYSARTWELTRKPSVSPHCGLGSNLTVQIKQNRVMRVLPRDNEAVNECWLSDKDRFSYEGLNASDRLPRPMIRRDGAWIETDWQSALEFAVAGLKRNGPVGWLASPHQSLEELYLMGKLARATGGNVDFRLRQSDFSADAQRRGAPWLGLPLADIAALDRVLVIGSTLRRDHPLIANRLRQAAKRGLQVNIIHAADDDLLMRVANRAIAAPSALPGLLSQVLKAVAAAKNATVPAGLKAAVDGTQVGESAQHIADSLVSGQRSAVWLGNLAQHHPHAAQLQALAQALAEASGAVFGFLGEAANSTGGYIARAVPENGGLNAGAMLAPGALKSYVLLGLEPEHDTHDGARALAALKSAEFTVALSPYQHGALEYADVLLPIAPFTETAGSFISTEGRLQSFEAVVQPLAETRPAWKVLRVLGNLLGVDGFEFNTAEAVRREALGEGGTEGIAARLDNGLKSLGSAAVSRAAAGGIERIGEVASYQADPLVRRSAALQATREGATLAAAMNGALFEKLGLRDGDHVRVAAGTDGAGVELAAVRDDGLPAGCIRIPAGHPATAGLGALFGELRVERIAQAQKVAV